MNIRLSAELMDEVITEALRHVNRRGGGHEIIYDGNGEMLLAKIDARLIVQVIVNIVDNAVKYTPPGSHILKMCIRDRERAGHHHRLDPPADQDRVLKRDR